MLGSTCLLIKAMDANRDNTIGGPASIRLKNKERSKPFLPRRSISDTDRERIVKAYLNGASPKTISEMLDIKVFTVYSILKQFRKTGKVSATKRGGNHKKKLCKDASQSIRNWLEEDSTLSLRQLTTKVWEQYRLRVCPTTIAREIRTLRATLQRRKLDLEARKWKDFATTTTTEASQSNDDSIVGNKCVIKEEHASSSEIDEQCSDDIFIGETVITQTNGWEQIVEPYKSEPNHPSAVNRLNESDLNEHHSLACKRLTCDEAKLDKDISGEDRLVNPIDTNEPNVNQIATSLSRRQQPDSNRSQLPLNTKTTEKCTFTMHMLDEPQTMKTITVSLPKTQSANDRLIDSRVETNVSDAPTTCTHCPCFQQIVSDQKKMLAQLSIFEQKIVDRIQQMQDILLNKLKKN